MINPIEVNGIISRAQDVSILRHNEENRGTINQNHFQQRFDQEVEQNIRTVRQSDDTDKADTRQDAKEKGRNEYYGDGGRKKKQENEKQDGKVIMKTQGGFDVKI